MTDLSPAAQAVLAAAHGCWHQAGTSRQGLAAALRAVADQDETVFSVEDEMEMMPAVRAVRTDRILAIAAELERRP